jgi:S1-C subfamily serine protease
MSEPSDWTIPPALQPKATQVEFDLQTALHSVVQLHSEIPEEAFTASILGTERSGNGIVIRHGEQNVVLTIGYLITEAHSVWLTTHDGQTVAGHPFAYDQVTGFGLVLPLGELNAPSLALGSAASLAVGSEVIVIGRGDAKHSLKTKLFAKREFAGYWEYLLDEALFTSPPHPQWAGTALIDHRGMLAGVGSLLIQEVVNGKAIDTNMFVPIELLTPILDDLMTRGKVRRPARPWLGVYATEQAEGRVIIAGVIENAPAHQAGLRAGDAVIAVADKQVASLGAFYRAMWAQGPAGSLIDVSAQRGKHDIKMSVHSASREDFLLRPKVH